VIEQGPVSPQLKALQKGNSIWIDKRVNGFFTLAEVPNGKHLWLLATGTGLGPFLSILKTDEPWRRFEKIILVHAVRIAKELTYQELIKKFAAEHPQQFQMIPVVSRETINSALPGRIPAAIENGLLEKKAGLKLTPIDSQIMICGNPEMITATKEILQTKGLKKNLRRSPGQITTENYWQKP